MIRPFAGIQTVGAASQPVFGTQLSAASIFSTDKFTGTNKPGTTTPPVPIVVNSTSGMKVGDRVLVGPKGNFTHANNSLLDQGTIAAISSSTAMTVQGLTQNHSPSDYLVLNEPAAFVQVTPVANASDLYLGTDSTVAANDQYVFDVIGAVATTVEPVYSHISPTTGRADSYQTSEYWISGPAAATFVARFHQN